MLLHGLRLTVEVREKLDRIDHVPVQVVHHLPPDRLGQLPARDPRHLQKTLQ